MGEEGEVVKVAAMRGKEKLGSLLSLKLKSRCWLPNKGLYNIPSFLSYLK